MSQAVFMERGDKSRGRAHVSSSIRVFGGQHVVQSIFNTQPLCQSTIYAPCWCLWMNDARHWFALFHSTILMVPSLAYSFMGSTRNTKEARADGRPHVFWQRGRSRNMGSRSTTTTGGLGTATATAISTAATTDKRLNFSPTWRTRPLMRKRLRKTWHPACRRSAPSPSAEVRQ